jgi:hypothetical protein
MTLVTRSSSASMDASTGMFAPHLAGNLLAGEALDAVAPCYIKNSDGKIYMADATAANEKAVIAGFTPTAYAIGDAVTLFGLGARFRYGAALSKGAILYLAATKGRLDDAATAGDAVGVAQVINATDIRVITAGVVSAGAGALPAGSVTFAKAKVFVSTEQTGTGAAQNVAHGLGAVPAAVLVAPTDLAPATAGVYTVTEGTHTSTNVVVTVTSGKKFKVLAWA